MTLVSLCCRSDDWLREALVFLHSFRKLNATDFAASLLIGTPCWTGKNRTDNHFHTESFTLQTYCHHWVGSCKFPVGADVGGCIKELSCNLVQYLSLEWDALRQYHIKSGDSVGGYHYYDIVIDVIYVAHLTMVHAFLSFKMKISLCKCFHTF